jgi:hypothetical protein
MDAPHHQLQDTNDRYLANIQRNGTFSVIPRVAAGEVSILLSRLGFLADEGGKITPEGLIVIGQVAKKCKLHQYYEQHLAYMGIRRPVYQDYWRVSGRFVARLFVIVNGTNQTTDRHVRRSEAGPSRHLGMQPFAHSTELADWNHRKSWSMLDSRVVMRTASRCARSSLV